MKENANAKPTKAFLDEVVSLIQTTRHFSLRVVENIVLWRDLLRHIYLMGTKAKQKVTRRMKVQAAVQLAYLHDDGVNYMIKMRNDTLDLNKLWVAPYFNFSE